MAQELNPLAGQVLTPVSTVSAGNSFERMGNAAGALSDVITDKLSRVAAEQAAVQGMSDAAAGTAPKTLMPGLTKSTAAYNKAVTQTEALRLSRIGAEQIARASLENSDPAKFDSNTPAKLNAEVNGIIQGVLENTRPENITAVAESLARHKDAANIKMLDQSIRYDNKQAKDNFEFDLTGLLRDRKNAAVAGDTELVKEIDGALTQTVSSYSETNNEIAALAPKINKQIEQQKEVDNVLSGYAEAKATNTTAKWMQEFVDNKQALPLDTWEQASKEVLNLYRTQKTLSAEQNAEEFAQSKRGIDTGDVNNPNQILINKNFSVPQQLNLINYLETTQAKQNKEQQAHLLAQQSIARGNSALIPSPVKQSMFDDSVKKFEADTGRPASLADMSLMILGESPYPVSGARGVPLGTDVASFNSLMQSKLESGSEASIAEAGLVYNRTVNALNRPEAISISGKALSAATAFSTYLQGDTTPEEAAALANKMVFHADDAEVKERKEFFRQHYSRVNPYTGKSKLNTKFKEAFGTKTENFKTDAAFGVFKQLYEAHYVDSSSDEAAMNATKYAMRSWGTSKYFPDGLVAQPVPEKELQIAKTGYAFDNQRNIGLQNIIEKNKQLRDAGIPTPAIEWANKDSKINISNLSDADKVMVQLGSKGNPKIKIDGHESEVVLVPGPDSRLGARLRYTYAYYDKFHNLQMLPDLSNTQTSVAQFSPVNLDRWSPGIFEKKNQEHLEKIINETKEQQFKDKRAKLLDMFSIDEFLSPEPVSQSDEDIINKLRQRLQAKSKPQDVSNFVAADNISIKNQS